MTDKKSLLLPMVLRFILFPVFLGALVLLPAGTFHFWQVYVYFTALMIPLVIAMTYFYRKDPSLIEKRMKTTEKEKTQKIFVTLSAVSIVGAFVVPGLDFRFGWSSLPLAVVLASNGFVVLSYLFIVYVFKVNSFASRVVEVQENQKVISQGPYALVRHPMYSGMYILYIATPLALDSLWGLIPASLLLPLLMMRILNEEKVLRKDLEGYSEYCRKTKFRLIPFVW